MILLLPAGRGTHVELGMALAWNKKIYLCASSREDFSLENTVAFYELPQIVRLTGTAEENLKRIINEANARSEFEGDDHEKDNFADAFLLIFYFIDKLWRSIDV